jgi:hypothetical protein
MIQTGEARKANKPASSMPCAAHQKIIRQRASGRVNALHLAHLFDHETQRDVHHHLVGLGAPHRGRNGDISNLANQSSRQRGGRAHHSLRQGDDVACHPCTGLGRLPHSLDRQLPHVTYIVHLTYNCA